MATRKHIWSVGALLLLLVAACNFSAGIKQDMKNGLTVKNSGLRYDDYKLTCNGEAVTGNEWRQGETMKLVFTGIEGFTQEHGRVFPGISIRILDGQGQVKVKLDDLLIEESEDGITPDQAKALYAQYTLGQWVKAGKEYTLEVRIFDKKGKGSISADKPFKLAPVQQNDLKVQTAGLSYEYIYFVGRNGQKTNEALLGDRIGVMIEGLKGLKEIDGKVYPGGDIVIYDKDGVEKFHSEDVFKDPKGNTPADVAQQASLYLTLKEKKLDGTDGRWVFRVWDKKGDASLQAEIMLKLIQK